MNHSGIYSIVTPGGKLYIGSSINIKRRLEWHRHTLRRGTHHARGLQSAANKYGVEALQFNVILCIPNADKETLLDYEQRLIDENIPMLLNGRLCASSPLGRVWTPEQRARMSESLKGIKWSPETIQARRLAYWKSRGYDSIQIIEPKVKLDPEEAKRRSIEGAKAMWNKEGFRESMAAKLAVDPYWSDVMSRAYDESRVWVDFNGERKLHQGMRKAFMVIGIKVHWHKKFRDELNRKSGGVLRLLTADGFYTFDKNSNSYPNGESTEVDYIDVSSGRWKTIK